MAIGPLLFLAFVALAIVVLVIGLTTFLWLPLLIIGLFGLIWIPIVAWWRARTEVAEESADVPSTSEASYEPVEEPEQRPPG